MAALNTVLEEAARLSSDDRLRLIEAVWDSIPEGESGGLSAEWANEIRRRSARYDAGESATVPWNRVQEEALDGLGRADPGAQG